jgi:hypothetical protein
MSLRAREVVADAVVAIEDFEAAAGTAYWRTRWVAVVAILRAVGHVATGLDAVGDENLRSAIDSEFVELQRTKPEPTIYWNFIVEERNRVLKEMTLGARLNITVRPGIAWHDVKTGETGGSEGEPTTYDHFMQGGIYDGRDPRELCREAVAFWNRYLNRVEQRAADARARAATK